VSTTCEAYSWSLGDEDISLLIEFRFGRNHINVMILMGVFLLASLPRGYLERPIAPTESCLINIAISQDHYKSPVLIFASNPYLLNIH